MNLQSLKIIHITNAKKPVFKDSAPKLWGALEPFYAKTSTPFKKGFFAKASLTIETALVLPLFLMFITAFCYFFVIMNVQNQIQNRLYDVARNLRSETYLFDDSSMLSLLVANPLSIKETLFDDELKDFLDNSSVVGGYEGVSTLLSSYNSEDGMIKLFVSYKFRIPYLPESFSKLSFTQTCLLRGWIGENVADKAGESSETVYVTATGKKYHLTKSCPYLDLSITSINFSDVPSARNASGRIYSACSSCTSTGESYSTVYITNYGTNYHASLNCSGLKRTVTAINISEVEDRGLCSKCGGN